MGDPKIQAAKTSESSELTQCPVCQSYVNANEGFRCPKCKRGPLCRSHRVPGRRECTSCVFDMKAKALMDLRSQESSIRGFMRLLQFTFLLFAVFFVSFKLGATEYVEFLRDTPLTNNDLLLSLGGLSVAGYILFFIILYNQKSNIRALEDELGASEFRRGFR